MIDNVRRVLQQVDDVDREEGLIYFERLQRTIKGIADYYYLPFEHVAAAFVSLSPNNDYKGNLRSLISVLEGYISGFRAEEITVSTYNACRNRAYEILTGKRDFLRDTRGPKIVNFYKNIVNPKDPEPVTIDGHMYSLWAGKRMRLNLVAWLKFDYDEVADGFSQVARENGIIPNQLQSMLWFTWKRIHRVLYDPQFNIFQAGDFWGLQVNPEDIRPFIYEQSGSRTALESNGRGSSPGSYIPRQPRLLPY